jgi:hypothetical protein
MKKYEDMTERTPETKQHRALGAETAGHAMPHHIVCAMTK